MFRLEISTANDAFADDESEEIARILEDLATRIRIHGTGGIARTIRDANGASVGAFDILPD